MSPSPDPASGHPRPWLAAWASLACLAASAWPADARALLAPGSHAEDAVGLADAITPTALLDLSLEELLALDVATITTASKREEKATAAPATAVVVHRRDLKLRGHATLTDVLRDLPGMETIEFYHSEYGTQVPVRGIVGNNKIIVLVNGMRVNPPGGAEFPFRNDFSVRDVDRIEVIYGPGSTLYGQDAISAVINVTTRRPTEDARVEAGVAGGRFAEREVWASFGQVLDPARNLSVSGHARYHDSHLTPLDEEYPDYWSEFAAVASPRGAGAEPDRRDFGLNLFGRLELGDTTLQAWHRESERSSSEGIIANFGFLEQALWRDRSTVVEARNRFRLTDRVGLESALTFNRFEIDPDSRFVFPASPSSWFLNDFKYGIGTGFTVEETVRAQLPARLELLAGGIAGHFTVLPKATVPGGAEPADDVVSKAGAFVYFDTAADAEAQVDPRLVPRASELHYETYGAYAELAWQAASALKVIAGTRIEKDTRFSQTPWTPRAALIYQVTPAVSTRYGYTRAYIAPAAYFSHSTFQNAAVLNTTNPDLQPEEAESHEVHVAYNQHNLQLGIGAWYGRQEGLIKAPNRGSQGVPVDPEQPIVFIRNADGSIGQRTLVHADNGGDSRNLGVDVHGRASLGRVSPWFSYSYVDYEEDAGGAEPGLPAISRHNGRLGVAWAVTDRLSVTPSLVVRSTPEHVDAGALADELDTPWEANLHLRYAPGEHFELFVTVRNLTDHRYALGGSRAAPGTPPGSAPRAIPQEALHGIVGLQARY